MPQQRTPGFPPFLVPTPLGAALGFSSATSRRPRSKSTNKKRLDKTHLTNAHDVDVVLGVLGVGDEGLDEELAQDAGDVLDLLLLAGAGGDPGLGLGPGLVQGQQTALAAALDELIGLRDELGALLEEPGVGDLGLVQDILDVGVLGELERG
jgi:hypothetical protein